MTRVIAITDVPRLISARLNLDRAASLASRRTRILIPAACLLIVDSVGLAPQPQSCCEPANSGNRQVLSLAGCQYIEHGDNVIVLGPPGVGKTQLAVSLGLKAIEAGYRVFFTSAAQLIATLSKALAEGRLDEKLKFYTTPHLLIIDEIGYLPIDRIGADLFFQLISRRYERGPMILTSNQSFGAWGEVFGDRVIATAILDRLLHHAVTLNIRGNSYRLKEKLKAGLVRSFDDQSQPGGEI